MSRLRTVLVSTILFLFVTFNISAQTLLSDYKGNILFQIPTNLVSPEISLNTLGVSFPVRTFRTYQYYVPATLDKPRYNTMIKSHQIFGGVKFNDGNEDETTVFNLKTRPKLYAELGWTSTIDELQNPQKKFIGFYKTFTIALFAKEQRLNIYNKEISFNSKNVIERLSPGFRVGANFFRKDYYTIALNGSYKREIPVSSLTTYQDITPSFYTDGKIASNGEIKGYLGPADAKHLFRGSIAIPVYWKMAFNSLQIVPIPYYSVTYTKFEKTAHYGGIGFSVFDKNIYSRDRTTDRGSLKFSDLASFSVGVNLLNSADKSNARFIYLSGSVKIGKLKKAIDKPQ